MAILIGIVILVIIGALYFSHKGNKKQDGPTSGGKPEGPRK